MPQDEDPDSRFVRVVSGVVIAFIVIAFVVAILAAFDLIDL